MNDTVVTTVLDGVPQRVLRTELADRLVRGGSLSRLARSVRHAAGFRKMSGTSWPDLVREGVAMKRNHGVSWPAVIMAANTPMMLRASMVDGRTDLGTLASGQVAGVIDDLPSCAELIDRDHDGGRRDPHPPGPAGGFLMARRRSRTPATACWPVRPSWSPPPRAPGSGSPPRGAAPRKGRGSRSATGTRGGSAWRPSELAVIAGEKPLAILCDVTVEDDVRRLFDTVAAEYGRIDVAVNNAGLGGDTPLAEMTDEQWYRVLDVTLNGTFRCTRAALRHMLPRGSGAIVNNASVIGWRAQAGQAHYAAAKAGVMALTRCAAIEAAPRGVRVNAVAPSIAMHPYLAKVSSEELLAELAAREAFGRAAEPWEVADVIVFLASGYSSYMTGEIVSVSSQHP